MFLECLGVVVVFRILKRYSDFCVSYIVDFFILGGGYWVIFMILIIGIFFFFVFLGIEG